MAAFHPWLHDQSSANVPLDQIFNLLHLEYGKDEVNALVTKRLEASRTDIEIGREHALIKRISSNQSGIPQIVTTNFDRLFEVNQEQDSLTRYVPPAFPNLNFGSTIEGITYLHGRLVDENAVNHPYVLSSADFGRAYLSDGWATNFIKLLLERYIVVLVGYQAEDPPVKYLLQGLNHDGQYDRSRLYAFDRGLAEDIEAKWRDKGVTAIAYSDHPVLWKSLEAWAERADDPRRWRASVIAKSQQDPKALAPYERGQVAHILRTVQGAKLFSEAIPHPHPEWLCVMDANIRSAKQKKRYYELNDSNTETFNPQEVYGLDDDQQDISDDERKRGVSNDNLLEWRNKDDNPSDYHRLAGGIEQPNKKTAEVSASELAHIAERMHDQLLSLDEEVTLKWKAGHILHRQITNILHALLVTTSGSTGRLASPKSSDRPLGEALKRAAEREACAFHPLAAIVLSCPLVWAFLNPKEDYKASGSTVEKLRTQAEEALNVFQAKYGTEEACFDVAWLNPPELSIVVGRLNVANPRTVKQEGFFDLLNVVPRYYPNSGSTK
ncbi:SIR2 family protein [Pectobacterium aroidearum]|uniref:SIR2 family protein n=1 Tax=Pectobacterium aroidearum TaxID=1201031 RepID=UPI0032EBB313